MISLESVEFMKLLLHLGMINMKKRFWFFCLILLIFFIITLGLYIFLDYQNERLWKDIINSIMIGLLVNIISSIVFFLLFEYSEKIDIENQDRQQKSKRYNANTKIALSFLSFNTFLRELLKNSITNVDQNIINNPYQNIDTLVNYLNVADYNGRGVLPNVLFNKLDGGMYPHYISLGLGMQNQIKSLRKTINTLRNSFSSLLSAEMFELLVNIVYDETNNVMIDVFDSGQNNLMAIPNYPDIKLCVHLLRDLLEINAKILSHLLSETGSDNHTTISRKFGIRITPN